MYHLSDIIFIINYNRRNQYLITNAQDLKSLLKQSADIPLLIHIDAFG